MASLGHNELTAIFHVITQSRSYIQFIPGILFDNDAWDFIIVAEYLVFHDDVMTWERFQHHWTFVWGLC